MSKAQRSILTVLSMVLFLSGCATARDQALEAAQRQGELNAQRYPPLPEDCRRQERSGVRLGERLDVALIRTDQALGRANARAARCAAWYDDLTAETAPNGTE